MRALAVVSSVLSLALLVAACAEPAVPRQPHQTEVVVSPSASPAPSPRARIDAALSRHERTRSRRVELTAAPDSPPLPVLGPTALAAAPSGKGIIVLSQEFWASRLLGMTRDEMRGYESPHLARTLLVDCFAEATRSEIVVSNLDISTSPTISSADDAPSPSAACVRKHVLAIATAEMFQQRIRVAARLVVPDDRDTSAVLQLPPSAASVSEEIAELGRMVEDAARAPSESARARELVLLLGARQLDAARLEPERREAHALAAREAFEKALAAPEDDSGARGAALHGLSTTLAFLSKPDEAARAARALVCPSRYPSPVAPASLDQDHDEVYWALWERLHNTPISTTKPAERKLTAPVEGGPKRWAEETEYRSPYAGCAAPANVPADRVAEAWRTIAAAHIFRDKAGGPFSDNRAATALRFAIAAARGEARLHASLELGRVLHRQQRYAEVIKALAPFASASDVDQELVVRAAQLVATSATYLDLEGAAESEPLISRPDVVDTEVNPAVAARKLRVVASRLETPQIVPQGPVFTPLVMRWAAWELITVVMYEAAFAVQQRFLALFPNHRDAPLIAFESAQAYAYLVGTHRANTPEHAEALKAADEARARLVTMYAAGSSWAAANRDDAVALRRAADLVRRKP